MSQSNPRSFLGQFEQAIQDIRQRPETLTIDVVIKEEIRTILGEAGSDTGASHINGARPPDGPERILPTPADALTRPTSVSDELKRWLADPNLDPPRRATPQDA
jgi:hypothetical protein